jgi:hypothetical protein
MRPEREAVRQQALRVLQQCCADSAPLSVRVDEKMTEVVLRQRCEADDAAVSFEDPGLVLREKALADEGAGLLR